MSARAIFEELRSRGWALLEEWKATSKNESVHLDFKAVYNDTLLARAGSGFANTEGGVLVFGVTATKARKGEADAFQSIAPIADLSRVQGQAEERCRTVLNPAVPGVDICAIGSPTDRMKGVLAVFIPQSDGGPHRAINVDKDVTERYYIRTSTNTEVAAHSTLAALFGQQPPPLLTVGIRRTGDRAQIWIENRGRGAAQDPRISFHAWQLRVGDGVPELAVTRVTTRGEWAHRSSFEFALSYSWLGGLIYSDDRAVVGDIDARSGDGIRVEARLDARNARPIIVRGTIDLPNYDSTLDSQVSELVFLDPPTQ